MTTKLLALYGLQWNSFAPDVPTEALRLTPRVEHFCWRVETLAREGGFALVAGEPGVGKRVVLRLLVERLAALRDVKVALLSRPQSGAADFYRECGDLFGVPLAPHNRSAGAKALREKWQAHIDAALFRPLLIVDEAQEMQGRVLNGLRLLERTRLDSQTLLSAVLAGDVRLLQQRRTDALLPLGSRVRVMLLLERAAPADLEELLRQALAKAGAPKLMTPELITTLCEHAAGNARALMTMAGEPLAEGAKREVRQLDEQLCLEVFALRPPAAAKAAAGARRR
jgi:type II secretory pathway predicted ATPase ExeA